MLPIATILGIINWCFIYIAIFIFLSIFVVVLKGHRELRDLPVLLTCNTCLAALLTSITVCIMTSSNLFSGFLLNNMDFCKAWGLFYDICECSIYYSYCLQAFFRLCRVVFSKKKYLVSHSLYIILIIGQWLLVLTLLLFPVFINWYARLPTEKYCLIPYTYVAPEVYHILLLYLVPIISIVIIYTWITKFMRQISQASNITVVSIQRQRNQRDLVVIKRIIMSVSILIVLRFPTIIFMIYGTVAGSLYPLTYGIIGVITSLCLIFIGIISIYITPQLRKSILGFLIPHNNRINTGPPLNQAGAPIALLSNINTTAQKERKTVNV